ncbi:MAG: tRNA threonylcarbamoyladenosine dehydratase [Clostridia bacterium]|nr:tRNA threonylcarbamoyladenosine dehydratase [Clostridia bacterium]
MMDTFSRTELLLGEEAMKTLSNAHVAVFGVGGVGGYVTEALARCGVGTFDLIDKDVVSESNINRQIIALHSTVGRSKVSVMRERILDISPDTTVNAHECFYLPENASDFDFSKYSYVVDAVDTVTAKLEIIMRAKKAGVPVISSMGAGNKLNPAAFMIDDIYNTSVCPLARVMRRELRKRGIESLKVAYSKEEPIKVSADDDEHRRSTPGSIAFVPSTVGLLIASEVVKDLTDIKKSTIAKK